MLELGPEVVEVVDRDWVVVLSELVEPFAVAAGDPNSGGVVVAFEVKFAGDDTAPAADWTCWED